LPPVISGRDANGQVSISNTGGFKVVFTVNGTAPTTKSPVYNSPFTPQPGSTVQAACVMPNGQLGIVASKSFGGLPTTGWKVVAVDSQETGQTIGAAANAIDGNPSTFWQTRSNADLSLPHYLTIDMGTLRRIAGFTYLPRQDGSLNGTVENYRFETSTDGANWTTNIGSGTFANIRNNPSLQEVGFAPVNARFVRFTALQEINNNGQTSAAEISVLPADLVPKTQP
jgi:alpha-L-fucosidase